MRSLVHVWTITACLLGACAISSDPDASNGQTHWMLTCDTDAECGTFDCLCGVCTSSCTDTPDCKQRSSELAVCSSAAALVAEGACEAAEAPAEGLCLAECEDDADCRSIQAGLSCR